MAFIDTLESNPLGNNTFTINPLEYQVIASKILMDLGDYSKANLVFNLLQFDYPRIDQTSLVCLLKLFRDSTEYFNNAKAELIRTV